MNKNNVNTKYNFFSDCVKYAETDFWVNIFTDLSNGVPPYGFSLYNDTISYKHNKDKYVRISINTNPEKLYNIVNKFLYDNGIMSSGERDKKKEDFNQDSSVCNDSWSSIRKKNTRELLMQLYVLKVKKQYNLSIKQCRYLLSFIYMAVLFNEINQEDIHIVNGKIEKIDGITYSNGKIDFKIDLYNNIGSSSNDENRINLSGKTMITKWEKYICSIGQM